VPESGSGFGGILAARRVSRLDCGYHHVRGVSFQRLPELVAEEGSVRAPNPDDAIRIIANRGDDRIDDRGDGNEIVGERARICRIRLADDARRPERGKPGNRCLDRGLYRMPTPDSAVEAGNGSLRRSVKRI